jgi:hypothetical protein
MANDPLRFDILELERKKLGVAQWPRLFLLPMNNRLNSTQTDKPAGAPSFRALRERMGMNVGVRTTHCKTKRTGELSEAAFLLKAETLGFHVAKPWGDSEPYDFILDSGHRLWRVQLKCTQVLRARGYDIQPASVSYGKGKIAYTADDIDVLVAHIVPVDTWYVLPVDAFAPRKSLRFYPGIECKCARWEKYREAWDLLRAPPSHIATQIV